MAKQKLKLKKPVQNPTSDAVSSPPGIFNTLFGDAQDQNAAVSIFSDNNPYRRKPQESAPGLGFAPVDSLLNPENDGSENPNLVGELKKRKRNKEKKSDIDSDSDSVPNPLETKKSKKGKAQDPILGPESNTVLKEGKDRNSNLGELGFESNGESKRAEEENPNLGLESSSTVKKKKKRKRDELEKEYEAKKYGADEEEEEEKREEGLKKGKKVVGEKRKTVDNAADMLVSKEGYDDEQKLLRTVFVGNLPLKVKKKALLKEFKQFGEVESVRIRSVPLVDTKKPRKEAIITNQINEAVDSVHAYIVFKTEESAKASLSHNMAVVGGKHIRVDRACPPRKKLKGESASLYDNKRTVFVGNLPFDVKDEELYQLFCGIDNLGSSVEAVRVVRHPHISLGKGIAYVLFKTREAANLILKKRNLMLRDRELRISHARQDSTPSKRPNPSPAQAFNSPAKRAAVGSRNPSDSYNRSNTKASPSYQGLRASKSGVQKKVHRIRPGNLNSKTQSAEKPKERKGKRPSVAVRKAKAIGLKDGGALKQTGIKRKLDSQTPESSRHNKKFKKFR